jgi:hypothetical protein
MNFMRDKVNSSTLKLRMNVESSSQVWNFMKDFFLDEPLPLNQKPREVTFMEVNAISKGRKKVQTSMI